MMKIFVSKINWIVFCLVIIIGDFGGIGLEIVMKVLVDLRVIENCDLIIVGSC